MRIKPRVWFKKPFHEQMTELRKAREATRERWTGFRVKVGQKKEKEHP